MGQVMTGQHNSRRNMTNIDGKYIKHKQTPILEKYSKLTISEKQKCIIQITTKKAQLFFILGVNG